ncbi:MAG: hypothetical protein ACOX8A_12240 [Thermacetogeniaceae bacterium]|jgi:hypothetical protein
MSRVFSKNNKELASLQIISSDEVWQVNKKGKAVLSNKYKFLGKIDRAVPNFILKANNPNRKNYFIDDTSSLPKRTKSKIVDFFLNNKTVKGNKRRVVYLVHKDKSK